MARNKALHNLTVEQCGLYRDQLRAARADVLADAEGFERVCFALELLGKRLCPRGDGLGKFEGKLCRVVEEGMGPATAKAFAAQYLLLRTSRNDYMHVGSHARNAGAEAVRVAWSLEKAVMAHVATKKDLEAGDLMVSPAVVAQQWTTVHEVRSMMLTRAFTLIPLRGDDGWRLISDRWLAQKLLDLAATDKNDVMDFNGTQVGVFLAEFPRAQLVHPTTKLEDLTDLVSTGMVLVEHAKQAGDVLGVIAPADLL